MQLLGVAKQVPLVIIGHHAPTVSEFDTVSNNDELGARLATRNREWLSFYRYGETGDPKLDNRFEKGGRLSVRDGGEWSSVQDSQGSRQSTGNPAEPTGAPVLCRRPEAIFCWQDSVAIAAVGLVKEMGLQVPKDVALVGYDDTAYSAAPQNAVTSVDQSGELLGVQATRFLLERINGRTEPRHFIVTPRVIQRDSSRRRH